MVVFIACIIRVKCTQAISTRGAVLLVLLGVQITNNSVVKRKSLQIYRKRTKVARTIYDWL